MVCINSNEAIKVVQIEKTQQIETDWTFWIVLIVIGILVIVIVISLAIFFWRKKKLKEKRRRKKREKLDLDDITNNLGTQADF